MHPSLSRAYNLLAAQISTTHLVFSQHDRSGCGQEGFKREMGGKKLSRVTKVTEGLEN
jgi:hypothetical protein